ncbi:unnamed protein product [Haemonchus placei]|uniref:Uncharacterized protein n=1 Tax=Haemonchus placei TaxID=6290 RepID=A0A0N4WVN6_HAEPC|nr:unnamed protein product [Haemonchus placei]
MPLLGAIPPPGLQKPAGKRLNEARNAYPHKQSIVPSVLIVTSGYDFNVDHRETANCGQGIGLSTVCSFRMPCHRARRKWILAKVLTLHGHAAYDVLIEVPVDRRRANQKCSGIPEQVEDTLLNSFGSSMNVPNVQTRRCRIQPSRLHPKESRQHL